MQAKLARWGNSLGVRIPKEIAGQVGLSDGARVDIEAEGERIIISLHRPKRYRLEDLLHGIHPDDMRNVFDWGPDAGREAVEQ